MTTTFGRKQHGPYSRLLKDRIISESSGQPLDKVARDTDRDFFKTAEEAKEYGLADKSHRGRGRTAGIRHFPDGPRAYVMNSGDRKVSVINTANNT